MTAGGAGSPARPWVLPSPHSACLDRHHRLPSFAAEGVAELLHVLHYAVYPELPRRVRVGLHLQTQLFGAGGAAPALSVTEKELLDWRIAILLLCQVDVFPLRVSQEGDISQA